MTETAAIATDSARAPLCIEGELTIYTAAETKERIVAALAENGALAIDLAKVGEIDSAGLQLLLLAKRETAARGGALSLLNPSTAVVECLDLCNMAAVFGDPADAPIVIAADAAKD